MSVPAPLIDTIDPATTVLEQESAGPPEHNRKTPGEGRGRGTDKICECAVSVGIRTCDEEVSLSCLSHFHQSRARSLSKL